MDIDEEKRRARGEASKRRVETHGALKDLAGEALAARGLPFAKAPHQHVVSCFFPYRSEISPIPLVTRLAGEGWQAALPIVVGEGVALMFRAWMPGEPTIPGVWGIPMPQATAPEVFPDVLLVPLLAFDRTGYRLGYGGGFYDRTLGTLRQLKPIVAIGVAYQAQLVDQVPRGAYDAPLDYVMTEQETLQCG
jgi:5-formyltetrahydrofolate cyclo-ligase